MDDQDVHCTCLKARTSTKLISCFVKRMGVGGTEIQHFTKKTLFFKPAYKTFSYKPVICQARDKV